MKRTGTSDRLPAPRDPVLPPSCAPGPNALRGTQDEEGKVAGFWKGLWHGDHHPRDIRRLLFNKNVNVYEGRNSGGWYNFGYILGLSMVFGGGGRGVREGPQVAPGRLRRSKSVVRPSPEARSPVAAALAMSGSARVPRPFGVLFP
ncbi:MAG: hypothetical protein M0C28_30455 [Candidatus Moduliflexus flocculans]|nr:hypothetical protein [Candidatus Moduliflexus flocculans]